MAPPSAISNGFEGVTDTEAIVLPGSLTVSGVAARRAKAGKLVAGTAAFTSSDFFKGSVCCLSHYEIFLLISSSPRESQRRRDGIVSGVNSQFGFQLTPRRLPFHRKQIKNTI
jgi:hypothetical protein